MYLKRPPVTQQYPYPQSDIKLATAILIRKHCYNSSKLIIDHSPLIEMLYTLMMDNDISFKAKELLATGLEYHFNQDNRIL